MREARLWIRQLGNRAFAIGLTAFLFSAMALGSSLAAPAHDFIDAAWIDGKSRYIYGSFTTAPAKPGVNELFIIGPIDENNPQDEFTLEPFFPYVHDHVSTKTPYGHRKLVSFHIVRPGPNATEGNLLTRTVEIDTSFPAFEPPGLEFTPTLDMPYAIDLGGGFETLISPDVIHDGIDAGILTTVEVIVGVDIVGWSGGSAHDTNF